MRLTDIILSKKANSLTKYPSIPTYHRMEKGKLTNELSVPNLNQMVKNVTEKVDGSNIRILILDDDYVIGSREEFMYARGDRVVPSKEKRKMEHLIRQAEWILGYEKLKPHTLYCIYGELYGSKIQKSWHKYTKHGNNYGFRVFDIWEMNINDFETLHKMFCEDEASSWRESGAQPWYDTEQLEEFTKDCQLNKVPTLCVEEGTIGETLEEAYNYLSKFNTTRVNLDSEKVEEKPEGIVVRTPDRKYIAKLRYEDYERVKNREK